MKTFSPRTCPAALTRILPALFQCALLGSVAVPLISGCGGGDGARPFGGGGEDGNGTGGVTAGTGGASATGGRMGEGGAIAATGGSTGSGGAVATGGASSGGATGSGGLMGSGGTPASGGRVGTGGSGGGAGRSGTGGTGAGSGGMTGTGGTAGRAGTGASGGTNPGTGGAAGRAGTGATGGTNAGTGGATHASCDSIAAAYSAEMPKAKLCADPVAGQVLCAHAVSASLGCGSGCITYVHNPTRLKEISTQWRSAGCDQVIRICPAILCLFVDSAKCVSQNNVLSCVDNAGVVGTQ